LTTTISIIWGVIIAAVAITWAIIVQARQRQDTANKIIIHLLNKIISDTGELDALRCNRKCGNRRTPYMYNRAQLEKVARDASMRDHQATICKKCQASDCDGPDFTKGICAGYTPEPPVEEETEPPHTQGGETATMPDDLGKELGLKEREEEVEQANKEAAASVTNLCKTCHIKSTCSSRGDDVTECATYFETANKEAPESLPEFDREKIRQGDKQRLHRKLDAELKGAADNYCDICVAVEACERCKNRQQEACDDFELDDH
jgi:hypothetical protein